MTTISRFSDPKGAMQTNTSGEIVDIISAAGKSSNLARYILDINGNITGFVDKLGNTVTLPSATLSGPIIQQFAGLSYVGTPAGGGLLRRYLDIPNAATVGGIEECTCYNVSINTTTGIWQGRDIADICWIEKWSDTGGKKELWFAATAAAGVIPTWTLATSTDSTVPSFTMGSGITGLVLRPMVGANFGALYSPRITPSGGNYSFAIDGVNTVVNSTGGTALKVGGGQVLLATDSGVAVTGTLSSTGQTTASGGLATSVSPEVAAATYTQLVTDTDLLVNFAGTVTLTLLNPATYPGRYLTIRTYQAQLVNSASANVSVNGVVGSSILAATAGKWAHLKSDGVSWEVITNN